MIPTNPDLIDSLNKSVSPYIYAPAVFLLWVAVLWLVKRFFFYRLHKLAAKTKTIWEDVLVSASSFPVMLLIVASGLTILTGLLPLPDRLDRLALVVLKACVILAITLFFDRLVMEFLKRKSGGSALGRVSQGFTRGLIRGVIAGLGLMTFLNLIGISITPILASLGIGSLAVALALQDTLSNFFAGLYVAVDKPVRVGDFIKLESGEEGYVTDIGWRSARIRLLSSNTVIIPNSKLSGSVITNYYLPDKEVGMAVEGRVGYGSDLSRVEKVILETARDIMQKIPGAVSSFDPAVRFHTFGDSGIHFAVALRAREFTDTFLIKHEIIKALHERFQKEGIAVPFPVRTVDLSEKSAARLGDIFK
jgi:small-conductance mechanosensitive channel